MKVAIVASTGNYCGIAAYTRALMEGMRHIPNLDTVLVPVREGKQPPEFYRTQADILNAPDIDLVHIQHEYSFWGGILPRTSAYWEFRYLIQKPVVLTAHTTYSAFEMLRYASEKRPVKKLMKALLLRNERWLDSIETAPFVTAVTIVHTAAARKTLLQRGVKPACVHVIPAGIPPPLTLNGAGDDFRKKWGLENKTLITLFGYITGNKGYELVLKAMPQLPQSVVLVIAGGIRTPDMQPYLQHLKNTIQQANLQNRVVITGYLSEEETAGAMQAADIALTPHTQATGSYSVAMPLAYGKPVLASDQDCFVEIALRKNCLVTFPSGSAELFTSKLLQLLDNPQQRDEMSRQALLYARQCSWQNIAASTMRVYQQAMRVYAPHQGMHLHPDEEADTTPAVQ